MGCTATTVVRYALAIAATAVGIVAISACGTVQPRVTSVAPAVATLAKTSGLGLGPAACNPTPSPPAPDMQGWWSTMQAANHQFPFAGWETWRNSNPGCTGSRLDVYRALATFNMTPLSSLKGLVQKAELVVSTRALPAGAGSGGAVTIGPLGSASSMTLFCPARLGGAGTLMRFPPNPGPLPVVNTTGEFHVLAAADPFPTATSTVYAFPTTIPAAGPLAGAASPTTVEPSGSGGSIFATDVTGIVNSALNGGFPSVSWMLTSNFEGSLAALGLSVPVGGNVDCKTSYRFELRITHL